MKVVIAFALLALVATCALPIAHALEEDLENGLPTRPVSPPKASPPPKSSPPSKSSPPPKASPPSYNCPRGRLLLEKAQADCCEPFRVTLDLERDCSASLREVFLCRATVKEPTLTGNLLEGCTRCKIQKEEKSNGADANNGRWNRLSAICTAEVAGDHLVHALLKEDNAKDSCKYSTPVKIRGQCRPNNPRPPPTYLPPPVSPPTKPPTKPPTHAPYGDSCPMGRLELTNERDPVCGVPFGLNLILERTCNVEIRKAILCPAAVEVPSFTGSLPSGCTYCEEEVPVKRGYIPWTEVLLYCTAPQSGPHVAFVLLKVEGSKAECTYTKRINVEGDCSPIPPPSPVYIPVNPPTNPPTPVYIPVNPPTNPPTPVYIPINPPTIPVSPPTNPPHAPVAPPTNPPHVSPPASTGCPLSDIRFEASSATCGNYFSAVLSSAYPKEACPLTSGGLLVCDEDHLNCVQCTGVTNGPNGAQYSCLPLNFNGQQQITAVFRYGTVDSTITTSITVTGCNTPVNPPAHNPVNPPAGVPVTPLAPLAPVAPVAPVAPIAPTAPVVPPMCNQADIRIQLADGPRTCFVPLQVNVFSANPSPACPLVGRILRICPPIGACSECTNVSTTPQGTVVFNCLPISVNGVQQLTAVFTYGAQTLQLPTGSVFISGCPTPI